MASAMASGAPLPQESVGRKSYQNAGTPPPLSLEHTPHRLGRPIAQNLVNLGLARVEQYAAHVALELTQKHAQHAHPPRVLSLRVTVP